jgi:excisionase family DNA binding protein
MQPDLSNYVTVKQAASLMGMHARYVRRLCKEDKLACVRFGNAYLVVKKAAETYKRDPYGRGRPKAKERKDKQ